MEPQHLLWNKPLPDNSKACKDCYFHDSNYCVRFPPALGFDEDGCSNNRGEWPRVDNDVDWCGEFRENKQTETS